jgi:hypothetical protein
MMFNQIMLVIASERTRTRQSATRTMASKWAFAGNGGSGYLMLSEMHAWLKALLERMAIDLTRGSILYLLSSERFAAAVAE